MSTRLLSVVLLLVLGPAMARAQGPEEAVARAQSLRDEQRYRDALALVEPLATRDDVSARTRLDALRELAILRLILHDDSGARAALAQALGRDPGFDLGSAELPPRFQEALADARASPPAPVVVRLDRPRATIASGSATLEVTITAGASAVDAVVALHRARGEGAWATLALAGSERARGTAPATTDLEYFVEARAPSGAVLAREGSAEAPLTARLPPPPVSTRPPVPVVPAAAARGAPARRPERSSSGGGVPTWVWIAGGALVLGGGVAAGVVLFQGQDARGGTWGNLDL